MHHLPKRRVAKLKRRSTQNFLRWNFWSTLLDCFLLSLSWWDLFFFVWICNNSPTPHGPYPPWSRKVKLAAPSKPISRWSDSSLAKRELVTAKGWNLHSCTCLVLLYLDWKLKRVLFFVSICKVCLFPFVRFVPESKEDSHVAQRLGHRTKLWRAARRLHEDAETRYVQALCFGSTMRWRKWKKKHSMATNQGS